MFRGGFLLGRAQKKGPRIINKKMTIPWYDKYILYYDKNILYYDENILCMLKKFMYVYVVFLEHIIVVSRIQFRFKKLIVSQDVL